jgi:dihydrofolate reductase
METKRKLVLYIAMSVDGCIAAEGDDLSFLNTVAKEGEDYGYQTFVDSVDTVIMGKRTYDWVLKHAAYPHIDKKSFIITSSTLPAIGNIEFYNGDLKELIYSLKKQKGKTIFCDGGAMVVNQLLRINAFDELIISIIPILVGKGIKLFENKGEMKNLKLLKCQNFESGLIQLHYQVNP